MLPKFTVVGLEEPYDSKVHCILNIVYTKKTSFRWLTFYVGNTGVQFAWKKNCKCQRCRWNRLRALFFLKPISEEEWFKRMEGGQQ